MKVSINFMYYMYYALISRVLLSTFIKNHCLKFYQCTLIREARRDRWIECTQRNLRDSRFQGISKVVFNKCIQKNATN